ncbi:MAG: hypothetical protein L0I76_28690 [Pseudonocardia sp.]|nr:hypothetical protein [Pseudonocardia sp.]MDN5919026.1 hypothetical protein [Pseudonocardia sp.]
MSRRTTHDDPTDGEDRDARGASAGSTPDRAAADEWVLLQTSVRPAVRDLTRSVCNGVTRAVGERYTLRQFLTEAVEAHAARLAELYNDGRPWPEDSRRLPRGRGLGDPSGASDGST